jgi:hypothetical protein
MNISRIWVFWVFFLGLLSTTVFIVAAPPPQWKDYQDDRVGIRLHVNREWQQVTVNESPQTGMVAFNIYTPGHVSVAVTRQKWDQPFDVWTSSDTLTQLFAPGYKVSKTEFAGRSSVHVVGLDHDGRRQEAYYTSRPPFVDDITFVANEDQWERSQKTFDEIKRFVHWTR